MDGRHTLQKLRSATIHVGLLPSHTALKRRREPTTATAATAGAPPAEDLRGEEAPVTADVTAPTDEQQPTKTDIEAEVSASPVGSSPLPEGDDEVEEEEEEEEEDELAALEAARQKAPRVEGPAASTAQAPAPPPKSSASSFMADTLFSRKRQAAGPAALTANIAGGAHHKAMIKRFFK